MKALALFLGLLMMVLLVPARAGTGQAQGADGGRRHLSGAVERDGLGRGRRAVDREDQRIAGPGGGEHTSDHSPDPDAADRDVDLAGHPPERVVPGPYATC